MTKNINTYEKLLSFLTTMNDAFVTLGAWEVAAVRALAYVLVGDTRDVDQEQFKMVAFDYSGESSVIFDHGSWPQVINALLRRFLTDEVLHEAHMRLRP